MTSQFAVTKWYVKQYNEIHTITIMLYICPCGKGFWQAGMAKVTCYTDILRIPTSTSMMPLIVSGMAFLEQDVNLVVTRLLMGNYLGLQVMATAFVMVEQKYVVINLEFGVRKSVEGFSILTLLLLGYLKLYMLRNPQIYMYYPNDASKDNYAVSI